jgi:hypothetical protein
MRRWFVLPDRIDVILPPSQWRVSRYPRGIIVKATGQFTETGTVVINAFRFGPPMPVAYHRPCSSAGRAAAS